MDDTIRHRVAQLLKSSGLLDGPFPTSVERPFVRPAERPTAARRTEFRHAAAPMWETRVVHQSDDCQHQWEIREGVKRCWLCNTLAPRALQLGQLESKNEGRVAMAKRQIEAQERAAQLGHALRAWAKRPNDQYGRWNAFCKHCWKLAVVCESEPPNLALVYGEALMHACGKR
ncbi:MAG: hypothetical protein IMZ55_07145, partial [Acidobacteria bacterium]|nr:hypothetical protein [Acidobacteriota bacterium]